MQMESKDFKSAVKKLEMDGVYLRKSRLDCMNNEKFEPRINRDRGFFSINETKGYKAEVIELIIENEENEKEELKKHLVKFYIDFKAEYFASEECSKESKNRLFIIEATFAVTFLSEEPLTQGEIEAYGKRNVRFNAWPYWRVFVQSTLAQVPLNIPAPPLIKDRVLES